MIDSDHKKSRSEYSKTGCKECKRRKIKCDEFINPPADAFRRINHQGRVSCWQCTRLDKVCEYPAKGERVARVSLRTLREQLEQAKASNSAAALNPAPVAVEDSPLQESLGSSSASMSDGFTQNANSLNSLSNSSSMLGPGPQPALPFEPVSMKPPHDAHAPKRFSHPAPPPYVIPNVVDPHANRVVYPHMPIPHPSFGMLPGPPDAAMARQYSLSQTGLPTDNPQAYNSSELALLASDLSNLVSELMYENTNPKQASAKVDDAPAPPEPMGDKELKQEPYPHLAPHMPGLTLSPKEHIYLHEFDLEFAHIILPFKPFDSARQEYFNPIKDILFACAQKEPFLLAAILAQGARLSFLKRNDRHDEQAYFSYLSDCLKHLGPAMAHNTRINDMTLTSNIESVLLTVLLLTSSNAANPKQNWRPHLRGAKDILLKHASARNTFRNSTILLVCKYWFISFEILAGLGSKLGGTVESDEELDLLFNLYTSDEIYILKSLGLVSPQGFYFIGGYHISLVSAAKDLIKLLNKIRRNRNYEATEVCEYVRLLGEFNSQRNVEYVNKKANLTAADFPNGIIPNGLLIDHVDWNQERYYISWMDATHQLFCLAAMVTLLTEFLSLSYDSAQVQVMVQAMTSYLSLLGHLNEPFSLIRCSVLMAQWQALVAGMNSISQKDRFIVQKVFDLAFKAGAGSASHSMGRLQRTWANRQAGIGVIADDNVDVVNY